MFINVHNKIIINDPMRNHAANLQNISQSTKQIIKNLHIYP